MPVYDKMINPPPRRVKLGKVDFSAFVGLYRINPKSGKKIPPTLWKGEVVEVKGNEVVVNVGKPNNWTFQKVDGRWYLVLTDGNRVEAARVSISMN